MSFNKNKEAAIAVELSALPDLQIQVGARITKPRLRQRQLPWKKLSAQEMNFLTNQAASIIYLGYFNPVCNSLRPFGEIF